MEMGELSEEVVEKIVAEAERRAALAEVAAADERRKQRELDRIAKATADADAADALAAAEAAQAGGDADSGTEAIAADGSQPSAGES